VLVIFSFTEMIDMKATSKSYTVPLKSDGVNLTDWTLCSPNTMSLGDSEPDPQPCTDLPKQQTCRSIAVRLVHSLIHSMNI
jgi:hypothetical protein